MFDVIEDADNEDDVLSEVFNVVAPGGMVLISVPGHQWLFSDYDEAVGTRRRYSRRALRQILEKNGFVVEKISGVFGFLIPFALVTRRLPYLLGRRKDRDECGKIATRAASLPPVVDRVLERWAVTEFAAGSPWGLSIFAVATKPQQTSRAPAARKGDSRDSV